MRVFIGSSSEAADKENPDKNMLLKIAGILKNAGADPVLWNEQPSIFDVGKTTIENLEKLIEKEQIEAAVFIYSKDDKTWFRGEIKDVPRDNVVFEHGLFTAILGRTKAITVKVGDTKIPSDLHGVTCIDYNNPYHAELNIMNWVKKLLNDNSSSAKNNIVSAVNNIQDSNVASPKKEIQTVELVSISKGTYKRIKDNQQIAIDKPFSISKNLITQFIYSSIMGNNPSYFKGDADLPVENVTFLDAITFCNKLSVKEGLQEVYTITDDKLFLNKDVVGYRLPFETEWEYALGYNNREITDNLNELAWYSDNSEHKTHKIGQKRGNSFGVYDLLGNVWEWCFDCKDDNSKMRILRGGSFADYKAQFTTQQGFRKEKRENTNGKDVGFRVIFQNNINN